MALTSILGVVDAVPGLTFTLGVGAVESSGTLYNLTADNSITFSGSASLGLYILTAENTLTFTQSASRAGSAFNLTGSSSLTFSQINGVAGPKFGTATSTLTFSHTAHNSFISRTASSGITFSQTARFGENSGLTATSNLDLTQNAHNNFITRTGYSDFLLGQTSNRVNIAVDSTALTASNTFAPTLSNNRVHLLASADVLTGASTLTLTGKASIPDALSASSTITFTGAASGIIIKSGTQTLTLTQSAVAAKAASYTASSTLSLSHAVTYVHLRGGIPVVSGGGCDATKQYAPYGGGDSPSIRPIPPVLTARNDVEFWYPFGSNCLASSSITLRTPNFGDRDRNQYNRISRESRGGSLRVYRDPDWPSQRVLVMDFSGVKDSEVDTILAFLESSLGQKVGFRDWAGRVWAGIITNPDTPIIRNGTNLNDINIEMEVDEFSLALYACNTVQFEQTAEVVVS